MNEKIAFDLYGLHLLEPMALITNWMMSIFSVYAYNQLKKSEEKDVKLWTKFFFWFAISTFFAGLGHLFFNYLDIPGKFPNWITAIYAGFWAGKAIIVYFEDEVLRLKIEKLIIIKGLLLLVASFITLKFVFVAVDAILTYVIFCGFIANSFVKKGLYELKFMVYGVLVCIPSIFIFFFKLNPHRWLNKDDLSHLLMLACIYFFYLGAKKRMELNSNSVKTENVIA